LREKHGAAATMIFTYSKNFSLTKFVFPVLSKDFGKHLKDAEGKHYTKLCKERGFSTEVHLKFKCFSQLKMLNIPSLYIIT